MAKKDHHYHNGARSLVKAAILSGILPGTFNTKEVMEACKESWLELPGGTPNEATVNRALNELERQGDLSFEGYEEGGYRYSLSSKPDLRKAEIQETEVKEEPIIYRKTTTITEEIVFPNGEAFKKGFPILKSSL